MRPVGRPIFIQALKTAFLILICIGPVVAARAATVGATAQVAIVTPLSIVKTEDLRFGEIIPGPAAGTVNINPATDARTSSGPLTLVGNGHGASHFIGLADRFRIVFVTNSAPPVLTRVGGGATMTITNLQRTGTLFFVPAGGFINIDVGGTLAVGANQPAGVYTGTFNVTMTYF